MFYKLILHHGPLHQYYKPVISFDELCTASLDNFTVFIYKYRNYLRMSVIWLTILLVVRYTQAVTVVEWEVLHEEKVGEILGGGTPPVINRTSTCPCAKLLLSSLGPTAQFQPRVLGVYTE